MSRRPVIAGNWKMNKTIDETKALIEELKPLVADAEAEVVFCPPFVNLAEAVKLTEGTNIGIGAQNMHQAEKGAFTGEVSGEMLKAIGVTYVVLGHSERREYYAETDAGVNEKTIKALALGLTPIVCCGETLEEREAGNAEAKVVGQIQAGLKDIDDITKVIIAYEPIWAIGTGKTATAEQAEEIHAFIRKCVADVYGAQAADDTSILYGGSCKASNAPELFSKPDIDGGLIGGASLKAPDFKGIIDAWK